MNRLELRLARREGFVDDVVHIVIDGADLRDLVRQVELPFATAEGNPDIAGGYEGLSPREWLELPERYEMDERAAVLACKCGEVGCWPLRVRIEEQEAAVVWQDFQQPYRRDWSYDRFGPFRFDRAQYLAEVARIQARARQADV